MNPAHLLALYALFLVVYDQVLIFRLKRNPGSRKRLSTYWQIMAGLWAGTLGALAVTGPTALWYFQLDPPYAKWIPDKWVIGAMAIVSLLAILAPIVVARSAKRAALIAAGLERLRFILPESPQEQAWWVLLSLSAGICEECIFRSFLLRYLHAGPWYLGLAIAIVLASVVFALGHLYQGVLAATFTGVLAILFFVFFLGTGSLLVPVVLHSLADLRVLFLIPRANGERAEPY